MFIRALIVFVLLTALVFGSTTVNLARIQLVDSDMYKRQAEKNQLHDTEISAERGIIYDANGTVLAKSASVWKVYIKPCEIENDGFKSDLCRKLSEIIGVDVESIKAKADKSEYAYLVVKRQIEFDEKEAVAEFMAKYYTYTVSEENDDGELVTTEKKIYYSSAIGIDPDVKRYYPYDNLASTVIGFTGTDDIGRSGVELKYDTTLTGTPGRIITAQNGRSDVMSQEYETIHDPVQGTSLVLTIDEVIQRYLEDSLEQVYVDSKGVGAYGVVMDVDTGAVLAMASVENYNLNSPQKLSDEEEKELLELYPDPEERSRARNEILYSKWRNFLVSDSYEPGSVFKIVTAAAAV